MEPGKILRVANYDNNSGFLLQGELLSLKNNKL
jgi:hypothetical protein